MKINEPFKVLDDVASDYIPNNTNLVPRLAARLNQRRSMMEQIRTRPFAAILALLFFLFTFSGVAYALGVALGYVPGVGLVENTGNLRMLSEPSSVARDGITVTVTQVMVYDDRVELTYQVDGVVESHDTGNDMCGSNHPNNDFWSDADAELRLPDGTVIRRDYAGEYLPENSSAMKPVYAVSIPTNVTEMTMLLKCIPFTKLGAAPENWEVPFKLVAIPAGTIVGEPVVEVNATSEPVVTEPTASNVAENVEQEVSSPDDVTVPATTTSNVPAPIVTMTLENIVPLESRTVFYISMNMENKDPSLISIMPVNVYVIDSLGQKLPLVGGFTWQPFEHRVGSTFEYASQTKPAPGPLTVTVENAVAYYAPLYTDPPQATPDEMAFSFDAGEYPQLNQTWSLDKEFTIAGYKLKVTSVRATNYEEMKSGLPGVIIDNSFGYEYGYEFAWEADPSVKLHPEMDIMSEIPICYLSNTTSIVPENSSSHYVKLCKGMYPNGNVRVVIGELSVLIENSWQVAWKP